MSPWIFGIGAAALLVAVAPESAAQAQKPKPKPAHPMPHAAGSDAALITSAMRAAPPAVGRNATIVVANKDGSMRQLRKGSNGFTCMPDNPATPGPDPMCGDANAMEWASALMKHQTPPPAKVGFMYMLEGGTDASNTDPYAERPTAQNHWISTGPHVMIVGPPPPAGYPTAASPDTHQPYVMWAGTPYAHLMLPVR